jgi:hypothetical protein
MVKPTWEDREIPILDAIAQAEEGGAAPDFDDLVEATGLDSQTIQQGVQALHDAEYVTGLDSSAGGIGFRLIEMRLLERGKRQTGQWPAEDNFEDFVRLLKQRIEEADDPETKRGLQRVLETVTGVGSNVLAGVLLAYVKRRLGFH